MQINPIKTIVTLAAVMAQACAGGAAGGAALPVGSAEEKAWLDHLVPLPKEARIEHKLELPAAEIAIIVHPHAGGIALQAAAELRALFGQTNTAAAGPGTNGLAIVLGLADAINNVNGINLPDARRLRSLPNHEQAYLIRPKDGRTLVIAALDERGLYYGAQTLKQLAAPCQGEQAVIPLAAITDWPDMPERGTWNAGVGTPGFIPWLAGLKLNFEHFSHKVNMNPKDERCPPLPLARIKDARERAFLLMPHCSHYDFWRSDILWLKQSGGTMAKVVNKDYFPAELTGQGDSARNPMSIKRPGYQAEGRCPCASSPLLQQYLTEWMLSAAKQGVREVCLWLTEYQPCYCACEKCLQPDGRLRQLQLETAASVKAIQETRKTHPDFVGRILLTVQSAWHLPADYWSKDIHNPTNWYELDCQECLDLIPDDPGIKVEKMYGSSRACDAYAKAGHWLSVYHGSFLLGIDWNWRGACPFRFHNAPETVRRSVQAWVAGNYAGSHPPSCIGDGHMDKALGGYTLAMFAEWSWNSAGRDPREFNRAWLTRQGYADTDKALAWLEAMTPLEQAAVYRLQKLQPLADAIKNHAAPKLDGPGFEGAAAETAEARFDALIAAARQARGIAEEIKAPDLQAESDYVTAAFEASRAVYRLAQELSGPGASSMSEDSAAKVSLAFDNLALAAGRSFAAWEDLPPAVQEQFAKRAQAYSDGQKAAILAAARETGSGTELTK